MVALSFQPTITTRLYQVKKVTIKP